MGARASSRSQNRRMTFSPSDGLLRGLLMDLGLTDTAKVLEEESRRRLQLLSFAPADVATSATAHGEDTASKNLTNRSDGINKTRGVKTMSTHDNNSNSVTPDDGNGPSSSSPMKEDDKSDIQLEDLQMKMPRIALFCALVHRTGKDSGEATEKSVLDELCRISIAPLSWNGRQFSTVAGNTDVSEDKDGKGVTLTSYLRELFKVLLDGTIPATELGEGEGEAQLPIGLSEAWIPIMEVFFAYVEVLWAQVCLVEAVSLADFTPQGWLYYRQRVLEQASLLQEGLQRLLLEAHQVEGVAGDSERLAPHQTRKQKKMILSVSKGSNSSVSTSSSFTTEVSISAEDMYKGIAAFFCRSEPTFRENVEEVSTWIMTQCGYHMQTKRPSHVLCTSATEPFTAEEGHDTTFSEGEKCNGQKSSARGAWNTLLSVVREALVGAEESSEGNCDERKPLASVNPRLRWALTMLRVHFFSWAVGSVAEFVDMLLQNHLHLSTERAKAKSEKRSGKAQEETLRPPSTVSAVLGFWYQNCAVQISERMGRASGDHNDSPAHVGSQRRTQEKDKTSSRLPPRLGHAKMSEEELKIGSVFVKILKRAAYEFFAGTLAPVTPLHLVLVGSKLPQMTGIASSSTNGTEGTRHPHVIENKRGDVRTALLGTLATGRLCQFNEICEFRHVSLSHLLKRALRESRVLLDLQDECVSVDTQLRAMENPTVSTILSKREKNGGVRKLLPKRIYWEQSRRSRIGSEPYTIRAYEEDASVSGEITSAMEDQQRRLSGNIGIRFHYPTTLEETGESPEPPGTSSLPQSQSPGHLRPNVSDDVEQTEETAQSESDKDDVSSTEHNLERSGDVLLNEVQIVSVTPCGSLMAFLTTKGRLVVFALRVANCLGVDVVKEEMQGSFCERLILDVSLVKEPKEPYWYEHLESFLAFSPSGNFLLCSVQNAPPFVGEGKEKNRPCPDAMGKVFIYSLHCTEDDGEFGVGGVKASGGGDDADGDGDGNDRLYGIFQIHTTLITVARWLDPRFWRGSVFSDIHPLQKNVPEWKCEAYRRLSALQCISSGRDNLILRWSPADGSIIQSIATLPVLDILVSPLMQAFYTINQLGQLSMYDAWNEHRIEAASENTVFVSQRGLPASFSMTQSSSEAKSEQMATKLTAPLQDGEKQEDFFVGSRIICFDRRSVEKSGVESETIISRMSKAVQKKGLPAGTETKEGSRLGRRMVRRVLHRGADYFALQTQVVVEPSSGSDDEGGGTDSKKSGGARGHGTRSSSHLHNDAVDGVSPFLLLRRRLYAESEEKRKSMLHPGGTARREASRLGDAVFYRTGSRLVFEEVSRALCHTAGIRRLEHDPPYASPPQPYHLLSMAASGNPVWDDEDDESSQTCLDFCGSGFYERSSALPFPSLCLYYTDVLKKRGRQGDGKDLGKTEASLSKAGCVRRRCDATHTCRRLERGVVLAPVARNGRYLCITASAGPNRAAVPYDRPLEFNPGIYACVVFDVLYGTVIRVIPVCPVLPREMLTENGVSPFHSNSKRAPIFMLPCSVTVVHRPRRPRPVKASCSVGARSAAFKPSVHLHECEEDDEERERNKEKEELENNKYNTQGADHDDDGDAMVLVAVGALHSTTYVFDALTGSRVKVVNLRTLKDTQRDSSSSAAAAAAAETQPPSKRARCSYIAFGESCPTSSSHSTEEGGEDEDVGNLYDSETSSAFGELSTPRNRDQRGSQREEVLLRLTEKFGVDVVLGTLTQLLCVVSIPFSPFSDTLQEGGVWHGRERQVDSEGGSHPRDGGHCGSAGARNGNGEEAFSSPPFSSMLASSASCPSFLGQLQRAAEGVFSTDGNSSCVRHSDAEVSVNAHALCHDVPFAFVGRPELPRALFAGEPSTAPAASAKRVRRRFRCGVVNSVALLHDRARGGVFLFSGDEYGGLFLTGDLISPQA